MLTGLGRDGRAGALAVRAAGGVVVAQDPVTALAPSMRGGVAASGAAQLVLPLGGIVDAPTALVRALGAAGLLGAPQAVA